jgi:SAM-dependent methyltransferase
VTTNERNILAEWTESAPYWEKHAATLRVMFAPITEALIEAAAISAGQRVLDIAGGAGEPSLTIARVVGPSGHVVCTDAVAEMVATARREAARQGLQNIAFQQCLADSLPFADDSFEVVVSRLGAMFFPDPAIALREMLRVAKPGGRLALVVWDAREFNPFFHLVTDVMARYIESPPEDPDAPGAFRFVEPGKLARILAAAGAGDIREQVVSFRLTAPLTPAEFWATRVEISDSLRAKVAQLAPAQLARAASEVQAAASQFFADGRISFPAQVIVVSAGL